MYNLNYCSLLGYSTLSVFLVNTMEQVGVSKSPKVHHSPLLVWGLLNVQPLRGSLFCVGDGNGGKKSVLSIIFKHCSWFVNIAKFIHLAILFIQLNKWMLSDSENYYKSNLIVFLLAEEKFCQCLVCLKRNQYHLNIFHLKVGGQGHNGFQIFFHSYGFLFIHKWKRH